MHSQVLVLDEPAAGLDPQAHAELLSLIEGLKHQRLSILMSSHNMDDLARMSDRILVLDRGEQLMLGAPEAVFADSERLRRVGLDTPFRFIISFSIMLSSIKGTSAGHAI